MRSKQPAIWTLVMALTALLAATVVAGCSPPTSRVGECPTQWTSGVVWTSLSEKSSVVQLFDGDTIVAEIPIAARKVFSGAQGPAFHEGRVGLYANTDHFLDISHFVTMDLATCHVTLARIKTTKPLNIASAADGFISVGNLNGISYLEKFTSGRGSQTQEFEGDFITALTGEGDHIYAYSQDFATDEFSLIVMRGSDLVEVSRIPLPMLKEEDAAEAMTVAGGKIVIPVWSDSSTKILMIDQVDYSVSTVNLELTSPYQVVGVGDNVFISHNPIFESGHPDLARHVSVTDAVNKTNTTIDLEENVYIFDVNTSSFAALSSLEDGFEILHTYSLPDFTPQVKVNLKAPSGIPNPRVSLVFLPH